jgi:hypothetical protein
VKEVKDKVEALFVIDSFEPEVPLVSKMLMNLLEWLVKLNDGIEMYAIAEMLSKS